MKVQNSIQGPTKKAFFQVFFLLKDHFRVNLRKRFHFSAAFEFPFHNETWRRTVPQKCANVVPNSTEPTID